MVWNVAGELQRPKNMTVGSKSPWRVLKAALCSSPSLMRTLLYPQRTSSLENMDAPQRSVVIVRGLVDPQGSRVGVEGVRVRVAFSVFRQYPYPQQGFHGFVIPTTESQISILKNLIHYHTLTLSRYGPQPIYLQLVVPLVVPLFDFSSHPRLSRQHASTKNGCSKSARPQHR